ncbi:hypothetical protein ABZY44_23795 [Streptomyces sp. NPDC006544]|uniref:hypothetical protein n=1 Tax=Streptomyces sp. NPDC006544 TaxID=3154583 RepID=UPI0033A1F1AD
MSSKAVSKEYKHNGGTARLEQDRSGNVHLVCTGCGIKRPQPGMAPGLSELVKHAA